MGKKQKKIEVDDLLEVVRRAVASVGATRMVVALSGGSDSVCLLDTLHSCPGLDLLAVHCNFHLRGEESMRDEAFCRLLCRNLDVPLEVVDFDVEAYRREHGGSVEMACRDLRYDHFRRILRTRGYERVATGHNADDNAETFMLNLMRGAGGRGLKGMRMDNGEVFRPLLTVERHRISAYLAMRGLEHVEDSTNAGSDYARNFIRNEVFPLLRRRWPGAVMSVCKSMGVLDAEQGIVDAYMGDIDRCGDFMPWSMLERRGDLLSMVLRFVEKAGCGVNMAAEMTREINKCRDGLKIRGSELSGKTWLEGGERRREGSEWEKRGKFICFERDGIYIADACDEDVEASECFEEDVVELTPQLWRDIKGDRTNRTLYLPEEMSGYRLRHPRRGDRIESLGLKGSQLVSDVMSDAKLTRSQREAVWLLEDGEGRIIWVAGLKRSRRSLLSPSAHSCRRLRLKE